MALLLLGTPVFGIFLIGAVATFVLFLSVPPVALHQIMFGAMENYALLAVPFFIFAGELMSGSGIARRLIVWVLALIGRIPGSLGVATVGACTLIGAISGASTATVAVVGKTLYPGLIRDGFRAATWDAGPALLMPVFVLAGIYLGWFSPVCFHSRSCRSPRS
jgi:C4-dicarboxylate transporter DctM subunit